MKILITGCGGFIGSHLCEYLLKQGEYIIGIDNLNDYYDVNLKKNNLKILENYNNFTFFQEDIRNTKIILEQKPDKIIHLASMAGVRYSIQNPELYNSVNVGGMINLLEQNKDLKIDFIYASSSSVYGNRNSFPFIESDKSQDIQSPYALSKLSMEQYAELFHNLYGFQCLGLRFFTVYGPRGRPDMAPMKFIKAIHHQEKFKKYGNQDSFRDYTYIDDIVQGIIGALNYKKKENQIFNLGNNNLISLNQFIETCELVVGKKAVYDIIEKQPGDVGMTCACIKKSKKYLNYNPKVDLYQGLKNTYEEYIFRNSIDSNQ
jgi:UDP-glucuronate 4-epimerase